MGVNVVETEEEAVGVTLGNGGLHGVVIRKCVVIVAGELSPGRKRTIGLNGFTRSRTRRNASCAGYLVNVRVELEIASMATDIGNRRQEVACEGMLNAKLPFIDSPHWNVIRHIRLV